MSRALNQTESTSVTQALAFLQGLIDCYKQLPASDRVEDQLETLENAADELDSLMNQGKIDVETARLSIKAATDGDGIHLNDASLILPGDLQLDICDDGYFSALWDLIAVFLHELDHYRRDTGFSGRVLRRVPNTIFGGLALVVSSALGETHRSWAWHENRAYRFAYGQLGFIEHMIYMICLDGELDCFDCCEVHKDRLGRARRQQNPHSHD